jgi:hypothetical protein
VLKKTGIIVSVAAAAVLGVGGFAFATTPHKAEPAHVSNISDHNVGNDCQFRQEGAQVDQTATGGDSLLGVAGAVSGIAAPVDTATQALNCTNVNLDDLVDSGSNNSTRTSTETVTRGSNNTVVDGD